MPKMDDFAISLPQQLGMLSFVSSLWGGGGCIIESMEIIDHTSLPKYAAQSVGEFFLEG